MTRVNAAQFKFGTVSFASPQHNGPRIVSISMKTLAPSKTRDASKFPYLQRGGNSAFFGGLAFRDRTF